MQLALQPQAYSINNSHLVKLHLSFMAFFLNRKDNISKNHRHSLERKEDEKFNYAPNISHSQRQQQPLDKRIPISAPNKYYVELKRNIKERAAELNAARAEKERTKMDECTFRPQVNPKSSKIAYRQVAEMHIG